MLLLDLLRHERIFHTDRKIIFPHIKSTTQQRRGPARMSLLEFEIEVDQTNKMRF